MGFMRIGERLWLRGRSRRGRTAVVAACAAVALTGGLFLGGQTHAATQAVSINNFAFTPGSLTVAVGDSVTWTDNQMGVPHTVTADGGSFDSGTLQPGASFTMTFSTAGTFTYHCNIHPNMHGTVVVTAAAGSGSAGAGSANGGSTAPAPSNGGAQAGQGMTMFHAGVNLVSVPVGTPDLGATAVFELNDAGDGYRQLDPGEALGPGEGYWAFFDKDTLVSLPVGSTTAATVKADAGKFILIGNPSGRLPATVTGADAVFVYDNASGMYHSTTTLQPGQGAWAVSLNGGTITISPAQPATATPAPVQNAPQQTQPVHTAPATTTPMPVYSQPMTNPMPMPYGGMGGGSMLGPYHY